MSQEVESTTIPQQAEYAIVPQEIESTCILQGVEKTRRYSQELQNNTSVGDSSVPDYIQPPKSTVGHVSTKLLHLPNYVIYVCNKVHR